MPDTLPTLKAARWLLDLERSSLDARIAEVDRLIHEAEEQPVGYTADGAPLWLRAFDAAPEYKVGDPDPTHADSPFGTKLCEGTMNAFWCTWLPNHTGPHVAGDGDVICAVWPNPGPVPTEDLRAESFSRGFTYRAPKDHDDD